MPAIHSGATVLKTKLHLVYVLPFCCPLETKKRACHCGGVALEPELLESKLQFSDPT
jgi:hypothetical protein